MSMPGSAHLHKNQVGGGAGCACQAGTTCGNCRCPDPPRSRAERGTVDRDVVDVGKVNPPAGHYREVIVKKRDAVPGDADEPVCIEDARATGDMGGRLYSQEQGKSARVFPENKCKCNADERHPGNKGPRGTGKETDDKHKVGDAFKLTIFGYQGSGFSWGFPGSNLIKSYRRDREKADGIFGVFHVKGPAGFGYSLFPAILTLTGMVEKKTGFWARIVNKLPVGL